MGGVLHVFLQVCTKINFYLYIHDFKKKLLTFLFSSWLITELQTLRLSGNIELVCVLFAHFLEQIFKIITFSFSFF